jgi:hypothetical protein
MITLLRLQEIAYEHSELSLLGALESIRRDNEKFRKREEFSNEDKIRYYNAKFLVNFTLAGMAMASESSDSDAQRYNSKCYNAIKQKEMLQKNQTDKF